MSRVPGRKLRYSLGKSEILTLMYLKSEHSNEESIEAGEKYNCDSCDLEFDSVNQINNHECKVINQFQSLTKRKKIPISSYVIIEFIPTQITHIETVHMKNNNTNTVEE